MLKLAITPGEPAGIGPELLVRLAQEPKREDELIAIADSSVLKQAAQHLSLPLTLHTYSPEICQPSGNGHLSVLHVPLGVESRPGHLNVGNAPYVLSTLEQATRGCLDKHFDALVTGPVHKGIINDAGIAFSGHTEFLAEKCAVDKVVMMLACEGLRVALVTTHLPLKDVSAAITQDELSKTITILHNDLRNKFGIKQPKILVCGLNPHAGENGHMGREELDVIQPVIEQLREQYNWQLSDPMPADTLFTPRHLNHADAVLAMYHDQGLPVLKYKGFGAAVNITLGLPFIRTSVDHGTALDLVGQGTADLGSLHTALQTARTMAISTNP